LARPQITPSDFLIASHVPAETNRMSALSTLLPTSAVQGTGTSSTSNTATSANSFNSLTPSDFVNMMVTQLENQDPLDPTNSQDILQQMSSIGQLQSSDQLQTTLTGLTFQNQIGAATSLIGKTVQGIDANNNNVTGTVSSVTINQVPAAQSPTGVATQTVSLNLNSGGVLPLANVTAIAPVTAATAQQAAVSAGTQAAATQATLTNPNLFSTTPS
jgi:flagellar basal-body rod modification protein FlgD